MTDDQLRDYLAFAKGIAKEAGEIARSVVANQIDVREKSENSPVTVVDEKVNALVIERVKEHYPSIGVLGEEEDHKVSGDNELLWVCDPLDGTIPFVLGIPASTFCLALVQNGMPVVGVVYDFANDKLYSAAKGLGAFCNDEALERSGVALNIVPVEWWHSAANDAKPFVAKLQAARYQTPNFASFGYTCMLVASGRIKGAVYAGDKPWDVVAAKVILEEIGFTVTSFDNADQPYDRPIRGAVVSDGEVHGCLFKPAAGL
jgi:fructose-1,6-bisphosphatase/inositol monophosphatase family enzyme